MDQVIMTHSTQALLETLQAARSKNPQIASTIDLHCALLEAQARTTLPELPPLPAAEAAREALAAGRPLIELVTLPLDSPPLLNLANEICDSTARYRPELTEDLAAIRRHLAGDGPQGEEAIPSDLLTFVLNQAWRPLLRAWTERMAEVVSITDWWQPVCPFCGGPPDLGAFDANTGTRYLLCSRCDAEWAFARLACPFCGDTRQQAYFPGAKRYRLYVCDTCHRYLKVVDLRQTWRAVTLPVERVLTVGMDLAARQAGYT
jgi:FdhE protein